MIIMSYTHEKVEVPPQIQSAIEWAAHLVISHLQSFSTFQYGDNNSHYNEHIYNITECMQILLLQGSPAAANSAVLYIIRLTSNSGDFIYNI